MASANVLKYFKRKKSGNYEEPVYIGAEQRFVSALRGTNNHNLEEQSILGHDCITKAFWEGLTYVEEKSFHDGTKTNDFYILRSYIYNASSDGGFTEGSVQFTTDSFGFEDEFFVVQEDVKAYFSGDAFVVPYNKNISVVSTINEIEDDFKQVRQDNLYYKNSNNEEIPVSIKMTYEKEENGIKITKVLINNNY